MNQKIIKRRNFMAEQSSTKEKEYESIEDQLREDGAILVAWGSTFMFGVYPVPSIDKVKLSIVKIGTGGKDVNNFYMDIDDFRRICEDVESGRMNNKLRKDVQNQYPEAYKFTSGKNGSKQFNIGANEKGICVQCNINDGKKWDRKITQVTIENLRDMSFYFRLVMGLIPCQGYYKKLYTAFWEGVPKREAFYQKK
jgi:hypothetical protein